MADRIWIRDLLLRTIIGVNDEERRARQDVLVNITLDADTRAAGASDRIEDAVNYRTITKEVIALVESSAFYLVEKMAAEIAALCLQDPRIERVRVSVEKPGALRFARSVGVEIERTRADLSAIVKSPRQSNLHVYPCEHCSWTFLTLGSNIDSEHNMRQAVCLLASRLKLLAVSRVYETAPIGETDQPSFLNAAAVVESELSAAELKMLVLEDIEQQLGRIRTADRNAPRTIDLDIVLVGDEILDLGQRHIPDPDILRYAHVAVPLADLAPQKRHPETGQTLLDIASSMDRSGIRLRRDLVLWPQ